MRSFRLIFALIIGLCILGSGSLSAHASGGQYDGGQAFDKLIRGAVNVFTGWVELPKRVIMTSQEEGPASGLTVGLFKGIYYGFVRTAAGLYEGVTFPFPAPSGYAPVMDPAYVFSTDESAGHSSY